MKDVTGCILIGGKSSRMGGGIKSLKYFNNKSILERIIHNSKTQVSTLTINSNLIDQKIKNYFLPIFSDVIKGYLGPLAGIHAALAWTKINKPDHNWVMTFAGDTPFFPSNLVEKLYTHAKIKNRKIILASSFEKNHPVFGLWHVSLEKDLKISIIEKKIRKIDYWAKKHFFSTVNFNNKNYDPFFNINIKEDLKKAEMIENQFLESK